jgi:hypothetical protein
LCFVHTSPLYKKRPIAYRYKSQLTIKKGLYSVILHKPQLTINIISYLLNHYKVKAPSFIISKCFMFSSL